MREEGHSRNSIKERWRLKWEPASETCSPVVKELECGGGESTCRARWRTISESPEPRRGPAWTPAAGVACPPASPPLTRAGSGAAQASSPRARGLAPPCVVPLRRGWAASVTVCPLAPSRRETMPSSGHRLRDVEHQPLLTENDSHDSVASSPAEAGAAARVWFIRDGCGMICAVLTWLLVVYADFVVTFVMLLPSKDFWYSVVNGVVFNCLAVLALSSHLRTMLTDPVSARPRRAFLPVRAGETPAAVAGGPRTPWPWGSSSWAQASGLVCSVPGAHTAPRWKCCRGLFREHRLEVGRQERLQGSCQEDCAPESAQAALG